MAMSKKAMSEKIEAYLALQEQIKALEKQRDAIKDELKTETAKAEGKSIKVGEHTMCLAECTRTTVDAKALTLAHPKIAAKFTKVTSYETFKVK